MYSRSTRLHRKRGNYYFVVLTTSAGIITGIINYLYHPMMIRYLSSADFAIFQSLMSLFNVFSVVSAGFGMYLTQQYSKYADDPQKLAALKAYRQQGAFRRGGILFGGFVLLSPLITWYLHLPSVWLVILVAFSYLFTGFAIVFGGLLQGTRQFEYVSCVLIAGALTRVGCGAIAMRLDWGIAGAIAAVSVGSLLSVTLQYCFTRTVGKTTTPQATMKWEHDFRQHARPIGFFALTAIISMALTQIDIFVVQHTFSGSEAGNYVAVSVLAKCIFFLAGAIETVYYPQLAKTVLHEVSHKQIRNYLILLLLVIIGGFVGAWLFGTRVLYLFKPHLVAYENWLERLLIASGSVFIFTTTLKLLVARHQKKRAIVLMILGIIAIIALHRVANALPDFVHAYTTMMLILAGTALLIGGKLFAIPPKHTLREALEEDVI